MKNYIWVAALKIENSSPLPVPPQGERLAARGSQVFDLSYSQPHLFATETILSIRLSEPKLALVPCEREHFIKTHCAVHGGAVSGTV